MCSPYLCTRGKQVPTPACLPSTSKSHRRTVHASQNGYPKHDCWHPAALRSRGGAEYTHAGIQHVSATKQPLLNGVPFNKDREVKMRAHLGGRVHHSASAGLPQKMASRSAASAAAAVLAQKLRRPCRLCMPKQILLRLGLTMCGCIGTQGKLHALTMTRTASAPGSAASPAARGRGLQAAAGSGRQRYFSACSSCSVGSCERSASRKAPSLGRSVSAWCRGCTGREHTQMPLWEAPKWGGSSPRRLQWLLCRGCMQRPLHGGSRMSARQGLPCVPHVPAPGSGPAPPAAPPAARGRHAACRLQPGAGRSGAASGAGPSKAGHTQLLGHNACAAQHLGRRRA